MPDEVTDMKKMTIELDENEANLILNALSEQPYKSVYMLVSKIQMQYLLQNPPQTDKGAGTPDAERDTASGGE